MRIVSKNQDTSNKSVDQNAVQEEVMNSAEMESRGNDIASKLQTDIVNNGVRTLSLLRSDNLIDKSQSKGAENTAKSLEELRNFYYNIGFAGGQSCGKSTMINAMIQYPLMPTCMQATTCTPVEIVYSENIRVIVKDVKLDKIIMDYDCMKTSPEDFEKLVKYTSALSSLGAIENLQYFTDVCVADAVDGIKASELDMTYSDPRHVVVLFMLLLTVYVNQNLEQLDENNVRLIARRDETLKYFGIGKENVNLSITIQWNCPLLKAGLKIIDLPGLGSNAGDIELKNGDVLMGHDTITKEAIKITDTMVVLNDPKVTGEAMPAIEAMISNLALREAVNPGKSIIPVLNKIDMCRGELDRKRALADFTNMLVNAGIDKTPDDIKCCSSIYGEYDYLECKNYARTLYFIEDVMKRRKRGWSEEKISEHIENSIDDLKYEYKNSGISEIREFFRSGFVERGKYEKSFTAMAALKALEKNIAAHYKFQIKTIEDFSSASGQLVEVELGHLEEDANIPIQNFIKKISDNVENKQKKASILSGLVDESVSAYIEAFREALDDYIKRNKKLAEKLETSLLPHHWKDARVDEGTNASVYRELKKECVTFNVSLSDVNSKFAKALKYCDNDIEEIYSEAVVLLRDFVAGYKEELQKKVSEYSARLDDTTIQMLNSMVDNVSDYTADVIQTAEGHIERCKKQFKDIEEDVIQAIMVHNATYIKIHADFLMQKVTSIEAGWLFASHEWIKVNGDGGLLSRLEATHLTSADKTNIENEMRNTYYTQIVSPMNQWYTGAATNINEIFVDLQKNIIGLFNDTRAAIEKGAEGREDDIKKMKHQLALATTHFTKMKDAILPSVTEAVSLPENQEYKLICRDWIIIPEVEEDVDGSEA